MKGLSDNKVFNKGREVAGDMRERWETSDSALVQRFQVGIDPDSKILRFGKYVLSISMRRNSDSAPNAALFR
jgi:hypothetical protein